MNKGKILYLLFSILFVFSSIASASDQIKIATFNCEFLVRKKVHVKFGLPFDIKKANPSLRDRWKQSEFRDQKFKEATKAVAAFLKTIDADVLVLVEIGDHV